MTIHQDENDAPSSVEPETGTQGEIPEGSPASEPETDAPKGQEPPPQESPAKAEQGEDKATGSDQAKTKSPVEEAIDRLVRKPTKSEQEKPSQPEAQAKGEKGKATEGDKPKEPQAKDRPFDGFTEAERNAMRGKTRHRIETLHKEREQYRQQAESLKPKVEQAETFVQFLEKTGVRKDLIDTEDAQVAGMIRFAAASNRVLAGKGTAQDREVVAALVADIDRAREALGLPKAQAPSTNPEAIQEALKALEGYDVEAAMAALKKAIPEKAAQKQEQTPPPPAQPPAPAKQDQAAQEAQALELRVQMQQAIETITADGVRPEQVKSYYDSKLWPVIAGKLAATYQGRDPAAVFEMLSPATKRDLTVSAHRQVQAQAARTKAKPPPPTPDSRSLRPTGSAPGVHASGQPTSVASAISLLAGDD